MGREPPESRDIIVETSCEQFWIGEDTADESEKEKERYLVALVPRKRDEVVRKKANGVACERGGEAAAEKVVATQEREKQASGNASVKDVEMPSASEDREKSASPAEVPSNGEDKEKSDPPATAKALPPVSSKAPENDHTSTSTKSPIEPNPTHPALQILHRSLVQSNFDFTQEGLCILSDKVENGVRKGWRMEAKRWRWCTKRESEMWRREVGRLVDM